MQDDIVINGKRALINQLIIGLVPLALAVITAALMFGADFSALKITQKAHAEKIGKIELAMMEVQDLKVSIAEIKTIVEFIRDDQKIIKEKIN